MINLNYLRYFYICAQTGSFTKAAARLRTSQPSLSTQIKTFEDQIGFKLFVRTGRTLQLTPKGHNLFQYASKMFEVSDDIEKYLLDSETKSNTTLKIGVSSEVERPFVAEIVGRLIKANSSRHLAPSIVSMEHEALVRKVSTEDVDILITNEKTSDLKHVTTLGIPVMLITGNKVTDGKSQGLGLQNIFASLDQKLITPTNEMILAVETKKFLRAHDLKVPVLLTSNIIACITRAVQEKLGCAFLPISYVQREVKSGLLQAFGPREGFWKHNLYLYAEKSDSNEFVPSVSRILQDFGVLDLGPQFKEISSKVS